MTTTEDGPMKKASGLGKKRAAEEQTAVEDETLFVLPGPKDDSDQEQDEAASENEERDLEMMFDTLEGAMVDCPKPSPQTVLLMRAVVHEADRLLKAGLTSDRTKVVLATSLYYLALFEKDVVQVDFLADVIERLEEAELVDSSLYHDACLLHSIYKRGSPYENHPDATSALQDFPASPELCMFVMKLHEKNNADHALLATLANIAGDLQDAAVQQMAATYLRRCLDDGSSDLMQRVEILIVYGGLLEALNEDEEAESAYAEARTLLEGKTDLPSWLQEFLDFESGGDVSGPEGQGSEEEF